MEQAGGATAPGRVGGGRVAGLVTAAPPQAFFLVSAIFHYLGPAFAVLLFARVEVLGVAWLRIASAAVVFAVWRRPWRTIVGLDRSGRATLVALGTVLAVMNAAFYLAIDRLPLGTVAAIEFLGPIALAVAGLRSWRNLAALALAVGGVWLLTDVRLEGEPIGVLLAFLNAALFTAYIVLSHRIASAPRGAGAGAGGGIDGLAAAMLIAALVASPIGALDGAVALRDPALLAAGFGVGIASSVIPYVCDQLAMARMSRATYSLLVALLPATATVVGVVVLAQLPSLTEAVGVGLVITAVAVHRERAAVSSAAGRRGAR